jgi:uncharacterized protein with PIN domain
MSDEMLENEDSIDEEKEFEGYGDQAESEEEPIFDKTGEKKIVWMPMDFSLQVLHQKKKDGDLDPHPSWQRNYVFDRIKASRLIESILLDMPIPAIYLAEEADMTLSVIDGQQRLSSFFNFLDDKFPDNRFPLGEKFTDFKLTGLQILPELNTKKYMDLDKVLQRKINDTPLHVITIKNDSDEDVKFEIFERLNTGSMKLNEDEIRNSVYRGPYIDLLKELAEDKIFDQMVRKSNFKNRMLYRGMILRFLALSEKDYGYYRPSMKQYCNKELREKRGLSKEKIDEYRKRFEKCVYLCKETFGENAFRRFKPGTSDKQDGEWNASRINMALFDVQMCGFATYEKDQIMGRTDEIRERMMDLMCSDEEFSQAIELKTSSTSQVKIRFKRWKDALDEIVSNKQPSPRTFTYSIKEQIFNSDPTCPICHNRIMAIEDAEVDHKVPFSKGGPTTLENAQIAHRYCNRHKSDKVS